MIALCVVQINVCQHLFSQRAPILYEISVGLNCVIITSICSLKIRKESVITMHPYVYLWKCYFIFICLIFFPAETNKRLPCSRSNTFKLCHLGRCKIRTIEGSGIFLPPALWHLLTSHSEETLGAEDTPVLRTFLPKIVFIKLLWQKKQQGGQTVPNGWHSVSV